MAMNLVVSHPVLCCRYGDTLPSVVEEGGRGTVDDSADIIALKYLPSSAGSRMAGEQGTT